MKYQIKMILCMFACGGSVYGCTLDDMSDLGVRCSELNAIILETGSCVNNDDPEKQCTGCDSKDKSLCKKYISNNSFESNRCPKEYMCANVVDGDKFPIGTNICTIRQGDAKCHEDQRYICYEDGQSMCVKGCHMCDLDYAICLRVAGDEDQKKNDCENGTIKCTDNTSYFCYNGEWRTDHACQTSCADEKYCQEDLDNSSGKNDPSDGCSDKDTKCENRTLYICDDEGHWGEMGKCQIDCDNGKTCINDLIGTCQDEAKTCIVKTVYECKDGKFTAGEICEGECLDGTCIDDTEAHLEKQCEGDEQICEGDMKKFCSQGQWVTFECIDSCKDGECQAVGDECDPTKFQDKCIQDNNWAIMCIDGKVAKNRCSQISCAPDSNNPLRVQCSNACTADSKEACAPSCGDPHKGYFWNNSGSVQSITCNDNPCEVTNGYVNCGGIPCNKNSKERCVPSCSDDKSVGYWMSNSNIVHTLDCSKNKNCIYSEGTIYCGLPEKCSRETAAPSCSQDNTREGVYCSSDGYYKTINCSYGLACQISRNGECHGNSGCVDGHYNVKDYPNGFIDCVDNPEVEKIPEVCVYKSSNAICSNDKKTLFVCNKNNQYKQIECPDDKPCDTDGTYGQCGKIEHCIYQTDTAKCEGENKNELYICSEQGYYYLKETCSDEQRCTVNDRGYGTCGEIKTCTYNIDGAECRGQDLYLCSKNGFYYKAKTCDSNNPCSTDGKYGQCGKIISCKTGDPARCDIEEDTLYTCDGTIYRKVQTCNKGECIVDKDTGYGTCGKLEKCNPLTDPDSCEEDGTIRHCNNKGFFHLSKPCQEDKKCVLGKDGKAVCLEKDNPGKCEPRVNGAKCDDSKNILYFCENKGYYKKIQCNNDEYCSVGENGYGECLKKDVPKNCDNNSDKVICVDNSIYRCNTKSKRYTKENDCGQDSTCTIVEKTAKCIAETCSGNEKKCKGDSMYICKGNRFYTTKCGDDETCVQNPKTKYVSCFVKDLLNKSCTPEVSTSYCHGKDLYICGEEGKYYKKTCEGNQTCTIAKNGYGDCRIVPTEFIGACSTGTECSKDKKYAYACNEKTHTYYHVLDCPMENCKVCSNGKATCGTCN